MMTVLVVVPADLPADLLVEMFKNLLVIIAPAMIIVLVMILALVIIVRKRILYQDKLLLQLHVWECLQLHV
jgi:hypothetical protein